MAGSRGQHYLSTQVGSKYEQAFNGAAESAGRLGVCNIVGGKPAASSRPHLEQQHRGLQPPVLLLGPQQMAEKISLLLTHAYTSAGKVARPEQVPIYAEEG